MAFLTTSLIALLTVGLTLLPGVTGKPPIATESLVGRDVETIPGRYILELEQGGARAAALSQIQDIAQVHMNFDFKLFQGVSIQLKANEDTSQAMASSLGSMPGVRGVWPVFVVPPPGANFTVTPFLGGTPEEAAKISTDSNGHQGSPNFPHDMTGIDRLHERGITGKGMKIAIVDTGVDYTHPALGGCFGKGCVISSGKDLVGDGFLFPTDPPHPDDDPMDQYGHGTHVTGIIAARSNELNLTGAAPDADIAVYKISGMAGYTSNEIMIAAFNMAYEDGADIITCSYGYPNNWPDEITSVMASRIVSQGVPMTVSAGNEGIYGVFQGSAPAGGDGVTSVASVDSSHFITFLHPSTFSVNGGKPQSFGYEWLYGTGANASIELPLYHVQEEGCLPFSDSIADLSGYVSIIQLSDNCEYWVQARNLAAKRGNNVLFYNNHPGYWPNFYWTLVDQKIAGLVTAKVGQGWIKELKDGKSVIIKVDGPQKTKSYLATEENTAWGGSPSLFTSWGPAQDMSWKPQIAAPGGEILSTYLGHGFLKLSGTSMATPLAAAAYALIAQARGTRDPQTMAGLLSSTARPQRFNPRYGATSFAAPVPQQGAGLLNAFDAAYVKTTTTPSSFSFNDTDHFVNEATFTLTNNNNVNTVTYNLGTSPIKTAYTFKDRLGSLFPPKFTDQSPVVRLSLVSVTLRPGSSAEITVRPTNPDWPNSELLPVWSGYIEVNGTDSSKLKLPYLGLGASLYEYNQVYEGATLLDPQGYPFGPNENITVPVPGTSNDPYQLPIVHARLFLGTPSTTVRLVSLEDPIAPRVVGDILGSPWDWTPRFHGALRFSGQLANKQYAAPGKYKFRYSTLRIFGNAENEEDWVTTETVAFNLQYGYTQ